MLPDDLVSAHFRLHKDTQRALTKLGIETIRDLLYHFPSRYEEAAESQYIEEATAGETVVFHGKVTGLKTRKSWRTKVPIAEGFLEDETGKMKLIWFHQPYLAKMIPEGASVRLRGKVAANKSGLYIANPVVNVGDVFQRPMSTLLFTKKSKNNENRASRGLASPTSTNRANPTVEESAGTSAPLFSGKAKKKEEERYPVYPESAGVTSLWFYHAIQRVLKAGAHETLEDPLPHDLLKRYHLPTLVSAIVWVHTPKDEKKAEAAKKRFAFEEIFFIQVAKQGERERNQERRAFEIDAERARIRAFTDTFPFSPTKGQEKAVEDILADFERAYPMSRLLEGDVGSGKTAVAASTAYAVATSRPLKPAPAGSGEHSAQRNVLAERQTFGNLQVAYMCPTEVLAAQQFESFIQYFKTYPLQIALITGSGCRKFPSKVNPHTWTDISRAQLLTWVANGEIAVVVGTHALIQKSVTFKHLAFAIIDEQHRFGTSQRKALARRSSQIETPQMSADDVKTEMFLYKDLSYAIRNAAFAIHNELGAGHKEIVYQNALAAELENRGIVFSREKKIDVKYRNKKVGIYQPDFVVDEKIIVELKALPFTGPREKTQLWNYLKGSPYKLALLINFGKQKVEVIRVVYDTARDQRTSASHLRSSAEVVPHLLSMTATPIPRTLALTLYGDLDLTLLLDMPAGRKPVETRVIPPSERATIYGSIRALLQEGRQAYVICPRIDEPDPEKALALNTKSVKAEAKRLKKEVFPEYEIGILHSKMTPKEKESVMNDFASGKINILAATSVVEVGVNVPNATVIIIEGAERFGLAQLHQLRGRVVRSTHQAYCYLFTTSGTGANNARLKALVTAKNGFELAERDLELRGAGELYGSRQWGISDIGMEALKNLRLVEAARKEAHTLVKTDPTLAKHPLIKKLAAEKASELHFE